jgi:hypothetical protein
MYSGLAECLVQFVAGYSQRHSRSALPAKALLARDARTG